MGRLLRIISPMPRRKRSPPDPDEQFDEKVDLLRVVEKYGDVFEDGLNALNYGQRVKAFERAWDALGDGDQEEIDRLFAKWLDPFIDQFEGRELRGRARGLRLDKHKKILDRLGKATTISKARTQHDG